MNDVKDKAQKRFSHYYGLFPVEMPYTTRFELTKKCCISEANELIEQSVNIDFWANVIKLYEDNSFLNI